MAANPNSFDNIRRGEPEITIKSKTSNISFDYFRRREPLLGMALTTTTSIKLFALLGVG